MLVDLGVAQAVESELAPRHPRNLVRPLPQRLTGSRVALFGSPRDLPGLDLLLQRPGMDFRG